MDRYMMSMGMGRGGSRLALSHLPGIGLTAAEDRTPPREPQSLLQRQAALWEEQDFANGLLLRGEALQAAERWAARHESELSDVERDFLQDCREAQRSVRRQQSEVSLVRGLLVITSVIGLLVFCLFRQTRQQGEALRLAKESIEARLSQAESARTTAESHTLAMYALGMVDKNPRLAILLALEALYKSCRPGEAGIMTPAVNSALYWAMKRLDGPPAADNTYRPKWGEDSSHLLTISAGGAAIVWDSRSGKRSFAVQSPQGVLRNIASSLSGCRVATFGEEGEPIVWEVGSDGDALRIVGPSGALRDGLWALDNSVVILSGDGGSEALCFKALDALVAFACRYAGRNLTQDEWRQYMGSDVPYRKTCPDLPSGKR